MNVHFAVLSTCCQLLVSCGCRQTTKQSLGAAMQRIALKELSQPGAVVIGLPDEDSTAFQRVLVDTAILPVLEWAARAQERGSLGRLHQLRNEAKDFPLHLEFP